VNEHSGVSFDFNDAPEKTGGVLNSRRNQRFLEECCEAEQCRAVRLFVTPTYPQLREKQNFNNYFIYSTRRQKYQRATIICKAAEIGLHPPFFR